MTALKITGIIVCTIIGLIMIVGCVLVFNPHRFTLAGIPKGFIEKKFDTGEVILNYVEGPDNGLPLLLIPGQMESWEGYKQVLPALSERFHVFAVDVRGNGKSAWTTGHYSYNECGKDLRIFLHEVIGEPSIISGLSSGAVLSIWLAADSPDMVLAVISEDPPIFSSIWPRIQEEKYMYYIFRIAVEYLGKPEGRDIEGYLLKSGIPKDGQEELMTIPPFIVKTITGIFKVNEKFHPYRKYDAAFMPFSLRASMKFLNEYDTDFSLATIDGRLSAGFDPEKALEQVECPLLLIQASWSRDKTWGLLGAMDDRDVERVRSLVEDFDYANIDSGHSIHIEKPKQFLSEFFRFTDKLTTEKKLQP
jgi:pimeloyl-ACP methyl ester carboxylesterase